MKFEAVKERIYSKTTSNQLNEDGNNKERKKKYQKFVCLLIQ